VSAPFPIGATSRVIDVDGPAHYLDMGGPVDGPLIVGLHGLGGSHLNWSAIGPGLRRHARVVALDLVGHGLTPAGARTPDMEGHRRLVSGFLRALASESGRLRPAILMGNSMGGLVAALQAAEEPDSVAGLILMDPALPTSRLGLVHPRVVANFLLCAVPGVGETYLTQRRQRTTAEQSVHRVLGVCCVDASRVPADVVEAHVELTQRLDRAAADAAYLRSARSLSLLVARPADTMERLSRVCQPTLLLHGARDVLVPLASAQRMSASYPEWRFEVAPDVGHVPMLEAPEWTVGMVTGWLEAEGAGALAASAGNGAGNGSGSVSSPGATVQAAVPLPPAPIS
jgi:pimeloyl-ACP methyl ester carboxylesterase